MWANWWKLYWYHIFFKVWGISREIYWKFRTLERFLRDCKICGQASSVSNVSRQTPESQLKVDKHTHIQTHKVHIHTHTHAPTFIRTQFPQNFCVSVFKVIKTKSCKWSLTNVLSLGGGDFPATTLASVWFLFEREQISSFGSTKRHCRFIFYDYLHHGLLERLQNCSFCLFNVQWRTVRIRGKSPIFIRLCLGFDLITKSNENK